MCLAPVAHSLSPKKLKANEKFVWLPFYFIFLKSFTFTKLNTFTSFTTHKCSIQKYHYLPNHKTQFFPGRYWHLTVWRCFNMTFQATDLWALAEGLTLLIGRLVFGGRQILNVPYISCTSYIISLWRVNTYSIKIFSGNVKQFREMKTDL